MNHDRTFYSARPAPAPRLRDAGVSMRPLPRRYARSAEIVLCWDERSRLTGVADNNYLSLYQYDANGDRTYKLTGKTGMQNVNGGWQCFYQMENATLYASPYLVATPRGYTKHYYAGAERVASRIGGGGLADMAVMEQPEGAVTMNPLPQQYVQTGSNIPSEEEFREKARKVSRHATEAARCLRAGLRTTALMEGLFTFRDSLDDEPDCYWYHTDHLGSSSWITYTDGDAVQHLHYLPFGENFVDQKSSSFDGVRYTFSAKEKDTETKYSYFGARYYFSELSIWLSVDPQSDKYPSLSPYVYCANNPVKLVDPNGEEIVIEWGGQKCYYLGGKLYTDKEYKNEFIAEEGSFFQKSQNALNKIANTKTGNILVNSLANDNEFKIKIVESEKSGFNPITKSRDPYNEANAEIKWNSSGELVPTLGGMLQNGVTSLAHELCHGYDYMKNTFSTENGPGGYGDIKICDWIAVYHENQIRRELGIPLRTHYNKNKAQTKGTGSPVLHGRTPFLPSGISPLF